MNIIALIILIFFVFIHLEFIIALIIKRNDLADIFWGPGIAFIAILALILDGSYTSKSILFALLTSIWATRLGWHIFQRFQQHPEDKRYQRWRMEWGNVFYLRTYVQVFLLQGLLQCLIAIPAFFLMNVSEPFTYLSYIGCGIWLFGYIFEITADKQLKTFLNNPANKGKLMKTGLWAYSRHPNYFGEVIQWWGLWMLTLGTPYWAIALLSPLTITVLILFVSGIPLLEKTLSLHPEFEAYKQKVSIFIPLPPKT